MKEEMKFTKAQVIEALGREWEYLCHEDPEDDDETVEEYTARLVDCSWEYLMDEADVNDYYTLNQFMETWGEE